MARLVVKRVYADGRPPEYSTGDYDASFSPGDPWDDPEATEPWQVLQAPQEEPGQEHPVVTIARVNWQREH